MCIRDRAYTDQLSRQGCVGAPKIGEIRAGIAMAEKASGAARTSALSKLVTDLDGSRSCDPKKIDLLKKALRDLQVPAM